MGVVVAGVGEHAPETERPAAAAPMHIVDLRDIARDEERLLRRDVVILQVEAARLRRRARRQTLVMPA
jgi:hypothetical protein